MDKLRLVVQASLALGVLAGGTYLAAVDVIGAEAVVGLYGAALGAVGAGAVGGARGPSTNGATVVQPPATITTEPKGN